MPHVTVISMNAILGNFNLRNINPAIEQKKGKKFLPYKFIKFHYRDSVSDFTSEYKIDGQDGNFDNIASSMPHTSGKNKLFFICLQRVLEIICFRFV